MNEVSIRSLVDQTDRLEPSPLPIRTPFPWTPTKDATPPKRSIIELAHSEPSGISSTLERAHLEHVERTNQTRPVTFQVHLTMQDFEHLKESGRWDEVVELLSVSATVKIVL